MNIAIGKDQTMRKNAKTTTETHEWLTATMRNGRRRIETLGWKRLASMYYAAKPARASQRNAASQSSSSKIRKAINAEARRCGYTPRTILALNAE